MLTIVTPTYNRKKCLKECYESLLLQTRKDFVWMIIDDGSNDGTYKMVEHWMLDKKIEILYKYKNNGGKASALNVALDNIKTKYAVCLDSDDTFYSNTVEIALNKLETIDDNVECCGLLALRTLPSGNVMGGKRIPKEMKYITAVDVFLNLRLETELICFYKAEILRQFRFPVFKGEKFVSPAWIQYEVTRKHFFLAVHDKMCCCQYRDDGLTRNKLKVIAQNPLGYTCVKKQSFEFSTSIINIVKNGIMYDCGCIISNDVNWLKDAPQKIWAIMLFPLALIVYNIRFKKLREEI